MAHVEDSRRRDGRREHANNDAHEEEPDVQHRQTR